PVDPVFSPDERLFRAVPRKDLTADGRLLPPAIEFPDFSVNRERYSLPEDVLLVRPSWGIVAFAVRDVPAELADLEGKRYEFRVEHVPEEENYSHSEVRTYREGQRSGKEPPKKLRTLFRLMLFPKVVVLKEPES